VNEGHIHIWVKRKQIYTYDFEVSG